MTAKPPDLDEQHAIALLKQGDLSGMETLVKGYQVRAVYAAYLIVQEMKLAEDIVQTAFLQAALKIDQFDASRPFAAWFLSSVIHASIKVAKRQKRLVRLDGDSEEAVFSLLMPYRNLSPGPEELLETAETRQMVWRALKQLPVEQRAAVIMRHFLAMSEKEIIREFNRPSSTVRWWLRAARSRLKAILLHFWESNHPGVGDEKE